MSDKDNPFAGKPAESGETFEMSKYVWPGAAILIIAILGLCLWSQSQQHQHDMEALRAKLTDAAAAQAAAEKNDTGLQQQIAALQAQIDDLQKEKDQVSQSAQGLEDDMRKSLASQDVTISKLQGKLTVNILDRIMYDSGEADLKPDGQAVLLKIAAFLAQHPELKIHVIGHTDNVPIRSRFTSNWELSTARALAAVHFLTEKAGVDPRRVGAVGYGEYRPIADNATAEGRSKNRRIAITILPNELAAADTAPAIKPVAPVAPVMLPPPPVAPAPELAEPPEK